MKILRYTIFFFTFALQGCDKNETTGQNSNADIEDSYVRPVTPSSSKWISKVTEYRPAPGQFLNTASGNENSPNSIADKTGLLSLGGFGGYLIFQFDHTVLNDDGYDFVILGNAIVGSSEPGIVMVAPDLNRNSKPDPEEWYELRGSEHGKAATIRGYGITYLAPSQTEVAEDIPWNDSEGNNGVISTVHYHRQSYYPLFLDGQTLTFSGTCLQPDVTENGEIYNLKSFEWGYADNYDETYAQAVGGDNDTRNGNKFDIDNAMDSDGNSVALEGIDFIKVYTGVNRQNGWIGEMSTEIRGAISLSVR